MNHLNYCRAKREINLVMDNFGGYVSEREFHENIKAGNLTDVEIFLANYPPNQFVYVKNESAVAVAVKSNQIEIYEALIARGLSLGPHERLNDLLKALPLVNRTPTKKRLRDIHKSYVKDPNLKHLTKLISKSKLAHDTPEFERRAILKLISQAFEDLNENLWIEAILKVVGTSESLHFFFDVNRETVEHMDPTRKPNTEGVSYFETGELFIAAKGLLDDETRSTVLGTLAHELCHFAMKLVYDNNCIPYFKHEAPHQEFEDIVDICWRKPGVEPYVDCVFYYKQEFWHDELIVRVPHLLALYKNNPTKLDDVKKSFAKLFMFFETKTLVDLQQAFPKLEAKNLVIQLNELGGVLAQLKQSEISFVEHHHFEFNNDKLTHVSSNCVQLSMIAIYQKLWKTENFESSFIFLKLETLMNEKILELVLEAHKSCTRPTTVIDCGGEKREKILQVVDKLEENQMKERIIFVSDNFGQSNDEVAHMELIHRWTQLTSTTREKLFKKPVTFQGRKLLLEEIFLVDSDEIPINELLEEKVLIGEELKQHDCELYVERDIRPFSRIDELIGLSLALGNVFTESLKQMSSMSARVNLDETDTSSVNLLCDEAGLGKTTELKIMSLRLKEKFSTRWIIFMELKEFVHAFEKDGKVSSSFDSLDDVANYFCEKILKIAGFEAEVFRQLLFADRVIFLLDGFDEISPSFKEFTMKLVVVISKTKNILWISSRPHLQSELQKSLDCSVYLLGPFTETQREKFLKKKLTSQGFESDKLEEKLQEVFTFVRTLNLTLLSYSPIDSLFNPLILKMVSDIFDDNQDIDLSIASHYLIYDNFTRKMFTDYIRKGHDAEFDLTEFIVESTDVKTFHQKIAFIVIFRHGNVAKEITNLFDSCFAHAPSLPVEQIVRAGFIYPYGSGRFQYIHQTFAEFFVADYLFRSMIKLSSLQSWQTEAIFKLIETVWIGDFGDSKYKLIRTFLESAFESIKIDSSKFDLVKKTYRRAFSGEEIKKLFKVALVEGYIGFLKYIVEFLVESQSELNDLWMPTEENQTNAIKIFVQHQPPRLTKSFLELTSKIFDKKIFKEMFSGGDNVFHFASKNEQPDEVLKFLLTSELVPLDSDERNAMINDNNSKGQNIVFIFLEATRDRNIILWKLLKEVVSVINECELKEMLVAVDNDGMNLLHYACSTQFLGFQDFMQHRNMLFKITYRLEENIIKGMFSSRDRLGRTPLMNYVEFKNHASLTIFMMYFDKYFSDSDERRKIFEIESEEGFTALHYAACQPIGFFTGVKEIYEKLFHSEQLSKMYARQSNEGRNILVIALEGMANLGTMKLIWSLMQSTLSPKTLKASLLHRNSEGKTIFQLKNGVDRKAKFAVFNDFIDKNFNNDEKRKISYELSLCDMLSQAADKFMQKDEFSQEVDYVHPEFRVFSDRLKSFETWPKDNKQTPEEIASAGLFFNGKSLTCFACGMSFGDFFLENEKTFAERHKRQSMKIECRYLKELDFYFPNGLPSLP